MTLAEAIARMDARLRDTHAEVHPDCAWRDRDDAITVNGWRWFGCADHAPSTDSGAASRKQTEAARVALRAQDVDA